MDDLIPILGILCAVGLPMVFLILVGTRMIKSRHEERMEMIRQGIILEEPEKKVNRYVALRNGLLLVGIALGLFVGLLVSEGRDPFSRYFILWTMPVLFAGFAFLVYFFIAQKMQKAENEKNKEV